MLTTMEPSQIADGTFNEDQPNRLGIFDQLFDRTGHDSMLQTVNGTERAT